MKRELTKRFLPYGAQILLIYGLKMALYTLIVSWACLPENHSMDSFKYYGSISHN